MMVVRLWVILEMVLWLSVYLMGKELVKVGKAYMIGVIREACGMLSLLSH